jgi:hypothetical protein
LEVEMAFDPNNYNWPDGTPKNCPPTDAAPADGLYFRVVKNIPPDETDFSRWIDEPHNLGKPLICNSCGVSLFSTEEGARKIIERFPNRWKKEPNHGVVLGRLIPEHGVIKQTGIDSTHHDLWKQVGVTICHLFG